ncbi:MAG: outer membrane beta-barrel protein [Bacteroidales bacterium]|nr:outer membrane beta-barrel protein [Bacteroidales bacterium]
MKQIIIGLLLAFASLAVNAQPARGKVLLGGNLGVTFRTSESETNGTSVTDSKTTSYSVLPLIGGFLGERSVLGGRIGVTGYTTKYPDDISGGKFSSFTFEIDPFFRYYVISGTGGMFVEVSAGVGIGSHKRTYDNSSFESLEYSHSIVSASGGFSPGVYYCLTPNILIETTIGWLGFSTIIDVDEDENTDTSREIGFDINPSAISFGVIFMF